MNQMEFIFEQSLWEQMLDALRPGSTLSAGKLLAWLEEETEESAEEEAV